MTEIPDAAMLMAMVKNAGAGFTDNKWDELLKLVDDQAASIQRVRELHYSYLDECIVCSEYKAPFNTPYPCATIRALDGE